MVRSGRGRTLDSCCSFPPSSSAIAAKCMQHHTCGLPLQQSHLCWPKGCEKSLGHWESSMSLNTKTVPVQAVSQTSDPVTGPIAVIFLVLFCFSDLFDSDLFEHTANID